MIENCLNIARNFQLEVAVNNVEVINDGYINDTYLLFDKTNHPRFVMQRINTNIFKDPEALADNKFRISKVLKGDGLVFIPSREGKPFYRDEHNGFWMMSHYIQDSRTLNKPINAEVAEKSAETIGKFHKAVADENPKDYNVIIPDFHNLTKRYATLLSSIREDRHQRVDIARVEIDFLKDESEKYFFIDDLINKQHIPQRVVHYDTKLSNILFNNNSEPICLIDYDTVMPGTWLFDFADAARSICNSSEEDERDLDQVTFRSNHYQALKSGYLAIAGEYLTKIELSNLEAATAYLMLEQAIRFLDDFLNGDVYYKTGFSVQNLQRSKVQIKLYESFSYS